MDTDRQLNLILEDQRESQSSFLAVVNTEKQLLASIYSKGLLHSDIIELYHKVRAGYEEIVLSNHQLVELQELEYLLWKLHYKHIDEFRKRMHQLSANAENTKRDDLHGNIDSESVIDRYLEAFKSFLTEASEFYKNLIIKLRQSCGLPAEVFMDNNSGISFLDDPTNMHNCQYVCHRFLVCLGDLARYAELIKKPDSCKWSTAATYYLEATRTWPDGGNPHNQLALLATYVGDAFLALYHCVRSLAVKEPFPDAWNNLILLFDENRSSHLHSLTREAHVDFSNPSERCSLQNTSRAESAPNNNNWEGLDTASSGEFDLWPVFIRIISFFFVKSSSEDFPCALASTVSRLESLLVLDNAELKATLESYQKVDSSRRGPYRPVQLVSILIFVVNILTQSPETEDSTERNVTESSAKTELALAMTFICLGRVTERCLQGSPTEICPLLPSVLVFLEWLVGIVDRAEAHADDERVLSAISYFFGALADFLNRLDHNESENAPDSTALWEDQELRGFHPVNHAHALLDFTNHSESILNFDYGNLCRSRRIFHAAMNIVNRSNGSRMWIFYDGMGRKFYTGKRPEYLDQGEAEEVTASVSSLKVEEPSQKTDGSTEELEEVLPEENQGHPDQSSQPTTAEEEEVILFKPMTRHNSVPLNVSDASSNIVSLDSTKLQTTLPDAWLRRSTSLSIAQSLAETESFSFSSIATNSGCPRPFRQQESPAKESSIHPAGPPSLSAWVLGQESLNTERERVQKSFRKQELIPIQEIPSTSLTDLSINETQGSKVAPVRVAPLADNTPPYVAPLPSAPLIPEDAAWFRGNSSFPGHKIAVGTGADGILGVAPNPGYTNPSAVRASDFASGVPGLLDRYPPLFRMSSSEWLYHYRNSINMEHPNNHIPPVHFNASPFGNFYTNDISRFDLYDQWGNHFVSNPMPCLGNPQLHANSSVYGLDEQTRDNLFLGNQRPFPYVCGVGTDLRSEQPPLLQYLIEREWQLQPDSRPRDPTFI